MFPKSISIHEAMLLVYEALEKLIENNKLTEVSYSEKIEGIWNILCSDYQSMSDDIPAFLAHVDEIYNDKTKATYDFLVAFLWFYDKERLFVPSTDKFRYKNAVFQDDTSESVVEEGIQIGNYIILPIIFSKIKGKLIDNYEKIVDRTVVHEKSIINRFLANYSVVKNANNRISLKTIEMHGFVERIKRNGLKVALNPITKNDLLYYFDMIYHTDPSPSFSVKVVKDREEELNNVFFESLKNSVLNGADLIIFPEMHLTENLLKLVPNMIKQLKIERQSLIMAGTLSNSSSNTAYLFDNYGNLILKQKKYGQLLLKDSNDDNITYIERREWDDTKDVLLALLDIVDYGRMSIFICKDVYDSAKKDTLINCSVDFLLMPSYSKSNSVSDYLQDLAKSRVISFFVNSFGALLKKKENWEKTLGKAVLPYWDNQHEQKFLAHILNPDAPHIDDRGLIIDLIL